MVSRRDLIAAGPALGLLGCDASAADAAGGQVLTAGVHRIDRDTVIAGDVLMLPGARLEIAAGATLRLAGDLIAPGSRLFQGAGTVDLTGSRIVAARPEWWGAVPGDASVDCRPALDACLTAHAAMQLGPGDYHLARGWTIARGGRRIWGVAGATRLVLAGATGAVVTVGTAQPPASVNGFLTGVDLRWIGLARSKPASGDATGLRIAHVLDCNFEGLRANEHATGFAIRGAVRSFLRDCAAFRSLASGGDDRFIGFDFDGTADIGLAGGNASIYAIDCAARTGGRPKLSASIGARLKGAFADTVLERFESTEVADGISIDGTVAAARRRAGHADLHIRGPVLDQCGRTGISLADLSDWALVDIRDPYVALAGSGEVAIAVDRSGGTVSVSGGQLIGWTSPQAAGIRVAGSGGFAAEGVKLLSFARPVELSDARDFVLAVAINQRDLTSAAPAVRLAGCIRGEVRARVFGVAGGHAGGIAVERGTALAIDATLVDPGCVGGTAVSIDGKPVRSAGTAGSVRVTGL